MASAWILVKQLIAKEPLSTVNPLSFKKRKLLVVVVLFFSKYKHIFGTVVNFTPSSNQLKKTTKNPTPPSMCALVQMYNLLTEAMTVTKKKKKPILTFYIQ